MSASLHQTERIDPRLIWHPDSRYADDNRMFQGIPSIERAKNGRLWVTWYGGGKGEGSENYVMLVTSADDGTTWSAPKLVVDPDGPGPIRASEPALWHDPLDRMWLLWGEYATGLGEPGGGNWAIVTSQSGAEDPQWSLPRLLSEAITFNKPVVLANGQWLFPAGMWRSDRYSRPLMSKNGGKTFERGGEIRLTREDRSFDEYMVVERRDGSLWLLTRTTYGIGESVSLDGGYTWSPVIPSGIKHTPSRFFLSRLRSGNLLLVKNGALTEVTGRTRLTAFLSYDEGASWPRSLLLDERAAVSYPDAIEAPDGTIYVVYDRERTKAKEILMAVFSEQDLEQQRLVSCQARLRIVVNKASGTDMKGAS